MRTAPPLRLNRIGWGVALAALALGGCSRAADQPGSVSPDDERQLNDAARMLDANSVDANALPSADESNPQ